MKLNLHISQLYLYVYIAESDGLKLLSFIEDFDETSINFDITSKRKEKIYINELKGIRTKINKKRKKNLINEYFM